MSFLAGNSEMARRIREFDWSSHPFGPAEDWPQSLRSALSICLHSAFPTAIYWGPELRLLYNDAWAPIPGPRHPGALGKPAREVWSDIWHVIEPQFMQLVEMGEGIFVEDQMLPMQRFGVPEETYWSYSFTAIRGEDGAIAGIFNSGSETTRNVLAQRQMRFLLRLDEAFQDQSEVEPVRRRVIELLGGHIGADRASFREFAADGSDELNIVEEWTADGVLPAAGSLRLSELGAWISGELRAGRPVRVGNTATDENLADARATFRAMDVGAVLAVPRKVSGKTVAVVCLQSRDPRQWNDFEESTAEAVLERTLNWVERRRTAERERIMIREIDHRARNAMAVVQSVVRLTAAEDVTSFRGKVEDRVASLARSHELLSEERWQPIELAALLNEELQAYRDSTAGEIRTGGPLVRLRPQQAQSVALVLHELATNAVKYGALGGAGGMLEVRWAAADGILRLDWTESGAAAEAHKGESAEEGFGSTLLKRVVENQLGGRIERSLQPGVYACAIAIPLSDVEPSFEPAPAGQAGGAPAEPGAPARETDAGILIVEDEALVGMDMEAMVEDMGHGVFGTVASVKEGLAALEAGSPRLAIVDMNLSGQPSLPLAEALAARGVPLIFATGYTEVDDLPDALAKAPRLSKPVSERELARTIEALIG